MARHQVCAIADLPSSVLPIRRQREAGDWQRRSLCCGVCVAEELAQIATLWLPLILDLQKSLFTSLVGPKLNSDHGYHAHEPRHDARGRPPDPFSSSEGRRPRSDGVRWTGARRTAEWHGVRDCARVAPRWTWMTMAALSSFDHLFLAGIDTAPDHEW